MCLPAAFGQPGWYEKRHHDPPSPEDGVRSGAGGPAIDSVADLGKPGFADEALPNLEAVYRFAIRLTSGHEAEADDVVQETFLRAYRAWESYTPGTNCRSWLFTICRNAFLRMRERAGHRHETSLADIDADGESLAALALFRDIPDSDPERHFFDSLIDDGIVDAIDRLPTEFREAVVLSDIEGLSYAEVADVLAIPRGTVKSRLFRGRRILQEALRDYAVETGYLPPRAGAHG